jgi:hypothetical protein
VFGIPAGSGLTGAVFGTVIAGVSAAMEEHSFDKYASDGWFSADL